MSYKFCATIEVVDGKCGLALAAQIAEGHRPCPKVIYLEYVWPAMHLSEMFVFVWTCNIVRFS